MPRNTLNRGVWSGWVPRISSPSHPLRLYGLSDTTGGETTVEIVETKVGGRELHLVANGRCRLKSG